MIFTSCCIGGIISENSGGEFGPPVPDDYLERIQAPWKVQTSGDLKTIHILYDDNNTTTYVYQDHVNGFSLDSGVQPADKEHWMICEESILTALANNRDLAPTSGSETNDDTAICGFSREYMRSEGTSYDYLYTNNSNLAAANGVQGNALYGVRIKVTGGCAGAVYMLFGKTRTITPTGSTVGSYEFIEPGSTDTIYQSSQYHWGGTSSDPSYIKLESNVAEGYSLLTCEDSEVLGVGSFKSSGKWRDLLLHLGDLEDSDETRKIFNLDPAYTMYNPRGSAPGQDLFPINEETLVDDLWETMSLDRGDLGVYSSHSIWDFSDQKAYRVESIDLNFLIGDPDLGPREKAPHNSLLPIDEYRYYRCPSCRHIVYTNDTTGFRCTSCRMSYGSDLHGGIRIFHNLGKPPISGVGGCGTGLLGYAKITAKGYIAVRIKVDSGIWLYELLPIYGDMEGK